MRIGVVANPVAGRHRGELVLERFAATLTGFGHQIETIITQEHGEAIDRSRELADGGNDVVISIGGDGTLNEVVNGVCTSRNASSVAVGTVAAGRGRDTSRTLGSLPLKHLSDPATWERRVLDLGLVRSANGESRAFINSAGFGFDAAVAARAVRFRGLPGTVPYFIATAMVLPTYQPFRVNVRADGQSFDVDALAVMASNGKYVGGGMKIAPWADPADGLLDILIMKAMKKPDFAANFLRVYLGTHVTHPAVVTFRATAVDFTIDAPILTHVDGEIEPELTTRFEVRPRALHWIGPRR